jgi:hypothetical protein
MANRMVSLSALSFSVVLGLHDTLDLGSLGWCDGAEWGGGVTGGGWLARCGRCGNLLLLGPYPDDADDAAEGDDSGGPVVLGVCDWQGCG